MRAFIGKIHTGLAWITVVAVVAQFLFAGVGIFGAGSMVPHMINGGLIELGAMILLFLALVGWLGAARIGLSALLLVLTILQFGLVHSGLPWVAALHPLNAVAILAVSVRLARQGAWRPEERREPALQVTATPRTPR